MEGRARRPAADPETLSAAVAVAVAVASPAPPRTTEATTRLGRYELLFELASGGMGTVHAARLLGAHGFDRLVAIKRLRSGEVEVEPFLAEARVGARITHPNVVQTLELGVDERGAPFIVMQLIEGLSLSQLDHVFERADEALDHDLAAWIVAQAAAGLHAAHEVETSDGRRAALVHRDVSPQNLLLSFDGRVYVTDFGIAKLFLPESRTDSGSIKGKFAYMSPEQTRGAALDRRTDVFALGVVLYELITRTRPFAATSPVDTIMRVVSHEPDPPRRLCPELPEELSAIAMKCLEKRPEDRFGTMAELGDALRAYLRRERAAVDEHVLAALLDRLCGDRKEKLRQRLRSYGGGDTALPAISGAPAEEVQITRLDAPPVVSTQGRTQSTRRWMLATATAFSFLGAVGVAFGVYTQRSRAVMAAPPPASASASSPSPPTPPPPPSSVEAAATPAPPSAHGAPRRPPPGAPRHPAAGGHGAATALPTPALPAAPAPFRSLGDAGL